MLTRSDFDENWFENTVVSKIYGILTKYPIVSTDDGYANLEQVVFPKLSDKNPEKALANLVKIFAMITYQLPQNVTGWNGALYHLPKQFQDNLRVYTLKNLIEKKEAPLHIPLDVGSSVISFLNTIYNALIDDTYLAKDLLAGGIRILPDQEKDILLKSKRKLLQPMTTQLTKWNSIIYYLIHNTILRMECL